MRLFRFDQWILLGERSRGASVSATVCRRLERAIRGADESELRRLRSWYQGRRGRMNAESRADLALAIATEVVRTNSALALLTDTPPTTPPVGIVVDPKPAAEEPPSSDAPVEQAHLVRVGWLDGDDYASGAVIQYVNLPREERWVTEPGAHHLDRLGRNPRIKVEFDRPGTFAFRLQLAPTVAALAYSEAEKARNPNFRFTEEERTYVTDSDGTKVIDDIEVPIGGTLHFTATATDDTGTMRATSELETRRRFWIVPIRMQGLTETATVDSIRPIFEPYGFDMIELPTVEIPYRINAWMDSCEGERFKTDVINAFAGSEGANFAPYALALAFCDMIAEEAEGSFRVVDVAVGYAAAPVTIGIEADHVEGRPGLVYVGYDEQGWLLDASYTMQDEYGQYTNSFLPEEVALLGYGPMHSQVQVDVSALPDGVASIHLDVREVGVIAGGLALRDGNILVAATRKHFEPIVPEEQTMFLAHEIGHKIHMVATGVGSDPDSHANYYTGQEHRGAHCATGAAYDIETGWTGNAECLMFGCPSSTAFCEHCAPLVKKVDLSGGWS